MFWFHNDFYFFPTSQSRNGLNKNLGSPSTIEKGCSGFSIIFIFPTSQSNQTPKMYGLVGRSKFAQKLK